MYKWYADDTALKKNHSDSKRPVFMFGGILISIDDEIQLSKIIKSVKKDYTGEDAFKLGIFLASFIAGVIGVILILKAYKKKSLIN